MKLLLPVLSSAFLCSIALSEECLFRKDAAYYLSLNDEDYLAEASNGSRIGECHILPATSRGVCDMYVKSAITGRDGDRGWPKDTNNQGTGCVRASDHAERISDCFYNDRGYALTDQERASFCTNRGVLNAVAMSKHALRNNACNLRANIQPVTCSVGDPRCPCSSSPLSNRKSIRAAFSTVIRTAIPTATTTSHPTCSCFSAPLRRRSHPGSRSTCSCGVPPTPKPASGPIFSTNTPPNAISISTSLPTVAPTATPIPSPCLVAGSPVSIPAVISLERVRRCQSGFRCRSVVDNPDNQVFRTLLERRQKKLFLTQVFKPPKQNTKNLVLVVAGQQEEINLGVSRVSLTDESNDLTGQLQGYKQTFSRTVGHRNVAVNTNTLVQSILSTGYFSKSDTFVGLVFDARFHFEYSRRTKDRQEDAYYEYIKNRLGSVSTVYLAGHSRGGCLVMRLASRLTRDFPNARVIVHGYDPVCTHSTLLLSSEFGVDDPKHQSPLNSNYEVYTTNMEDRFLHRKCLAIRNFLSGEKVLIDDIRAFGHRGFAGSTLQKQSLRTQSGFAWYTQSFHNFHHNSIDSFLHSYAKIHLIHAMKSLPCECGKP